MNFTERNALVPLVLAAMKLLDFGLPVLVKKAYTVQGKRDVFDASLIRGRQVTKDPGCPGGLLISKSFAKNRMRWKKEVGPGVGAVEGRRAKTH